MQEHRFPFSGNAEEDGVENVILSVGHFQRGSNRKDPVVVFPLAGAKIRTAYILENLRL